MDSEKNVDVATGGSRDIDIRRCEDLAGMHWTSQPEGAVARRFSELAPRTNIVNAFLIGAGFGYAVHEAVRRAAERHRRHVASGLPRVYIRYSDALENRPEGESAIIDQIIATMQAEGRITQARYGKAIRTSHAKSHGLVKGELRVFEHLPPELRQGMFAEPRAYPVVVRVSHVPGEFLDDRKVSTPRGMAIKVFDVTGELLPGHEGEVTQDFVLDTGKTFPSPDASAFLRAIGLLRKATPAPEAVKQVISATSRVTNAVLNSVGLNSASLDLFGHPAFHPLAEAYFSQAPLRYGEYVGKIAVLPVTDKLRAMVGRSVDVSRDENALRQTVTDYFRTNQAEYDVAVQLCTNVERMPIEDASREWSEAESPYRSVARLILPAQDALSQIGKEEGLSFCPNHSLAAHRPLGSINRARLRVYEVMGNGRRRENGHATAEPRTLADV